MWALVSDTLTDDFQKLDKGLEVFEIGIENYRSPIFKTNALASFGFTETELPVLTDGQAGYTPVVETNFELSPESEIFCYVLNGKYSVDSFKNLFSLSLVENNSFFNLETTTFVFTNLTTFDTKQTIEYIIDTNPVDFLFNLDLEEYNLDSVELVNVEGLKFTNPTFTNNLLSIQGEVNCRPFRGQSALIEGSKSFNQINSTFIKGFYFDLTSLDLDYVDKVDYQNKSYQFYVTPQSGSLSYNRSIKRLYLWQ